MASPTLLLTHYDRALLSGRHGPAAKLAMSILARMAEVYGATEMMDISGAHIDSTIYIGEAGLAFAERLASLGAKVAVPTTLNVSGLDEHHWQEWAVPRDWAEKAHRQMIAYQSMGCAPTWTCAPYQTEMRPHFGQQIAWGESNAIVFANSVLGARTERYPDLLDICCAITGRVPAVGLHLTENRAGELLFRLIDVPLPLQQDDSFYPVLGHLVGKIAQDRIPVIEGLTARPSEDQLKAFGAATASSGAVALFHIVGVTPEAPTREAAFQGHQPRQTIDVTMDDLRAARRELTTADGEQLHMVVLGSPHFSIAEFKQLAPLLAGKRAHPDVQFLVTSSRTMTELAKRAGYLKMLEDYGGRVTVDTCILATPMLPPEIELLMTNSAKYAYYAPGLLKTRVTFGSLSDCVNSAVAGRVVRDESLWGAMPDVDDRLNREDVEIPKDQNLAPSRSATDLEPHTPIRGMTIIAGRCDSETLVSAEPLSFWGGYDFRTGEIIDRRHPLAGQNASGKILAVPFTRGSSTTTAVLLEAVRAGTAPAAILTTAADTFFALASIVADELYARSIPIIALYPNDFARLHTGDRLRIEEDGTVTLRED